MNKIAIFSDIHGNEQALKSILNDIKLKNIEKIYCLGDVIAIGPSPKECLDLIIDNNIEMVLGNHELYYLKGTEIDDEMSENEINHQKWVKEQLNEKHRNILNMCKMKITTKIGKYNISLQHFLFNSNANDLYPFHDLNIVKNGSINLIAENLDNDLTFIGHEHKAFSIQDGSKRLIDIGSSGCVKDNNTFYTILSVENNNINIEKIILNYDREKFEKVFNTKDYPDKDIIGKIFFGINS